MRLIEKIVNVGFSPNATDPETADELEHRRRIVQQVSIEDPIIDISNVASYYYAGTSQDFFDIRQDFPTVAPPFQRFWMEWTIPETIRKGEKVEKFISRGRSGAIWEFREAEAIRGTQMYGAELVEKNPSARWAAVAFTAFGFNGKAYPGRFAAAYAIADDGRPIAHQLVVDGRLSLTQEQGMDVLAGFHPYLLAISFMHCKNVSLEQAKRSFAERHNSRGRKPVAKIYTLSIDPMKQVLRNEGQSESTGLKQALHICRGHFKDYRQSGLFGKVKGIFWWDSTVRGSSKEGVIAKDYSIKGPK